MSVDGGLTWSNPINVITVASSSPDRGSITVDPGNSNLVYTAWNTGLFGGTATAQFTRTTDGGQSWEPNRAIYTAPAGNLVWNVKVEPLPDGTLDCLFTEAILTGYAYETIPGRAIIAGKTKGRDDAEPTASLNKRIPEPATLGALALGAPGLAIWRREEAVTAAPRPNKS